VPRDGILAGSRAAAAKRGPRRAHPSGVSTDPAASPDLERELARLSRRVEAVRARVPPRRCALVALTGIDGSGKGFVAARLRARLERAGLRTGVLGVDGWLALPDVRFDPRDPPGTFYRRALRFDAMFAELVLPLRERRSIVLAADFAEETATRYRRHVYAYEDLDVLLLEGIFLLKRELRDGRYDLAAWIDCSFETALERALARAQEGLPPDATVRAYETVYFPAQRLHLARDRPRAAADLRVVNDPRLG
jgi:uridine kinase